MPRRTIAQVDAQLAACRSALARADARLAERERDLGGARGALVAAQEVLRAINDGAGDAQAVLDGIVGEAGRLLDASTVRVQLRFGDATRGVAQWLRPGSSLTPGPASLAAPSGPIPATPGTVSGRAMVERRLVAVDDSAVVEGEYPDLHAHWMARHGRPARWRSSAVCPLLRRGEAVGVLAVARDHPRPFTDDEQRLLETFADQAVIAIENARLFSELRERLEEQTSTAEVLASISHAPTDLQRVLDTITRSAARLCDGEGATIHYGPPDDVRVLSVTGEAPSLLGVGDRLPLVAGGPVSRVYATGELFHTADLGEDERLPETLRRAAAERGLGAVVTAPLAAAGEVRGTIAVRRAESRAFTDRQVALIKTFADQAVIAIENSRLFRELQERNDDLAGSLAQERAVGEILRVINASPTDVQPVFRAVTEHTEALLDGAAAALVRYEGASAVTVAWGPRFVAALAEPVDEAFERHQVYRIDEPRTMMGMVHARQRTVHVADAQAHPDPDDPDHDWVAVELGVHPVLGVPLWRDGAVTGLIICSRREARPFTDREIALVETFAAQAAIALANADLFRALQERTAELTASVERLTALSEVSGAVSATLDLDRVLATVVQRAAGLAGAEAGTIYVYDPDEGVFEPRANHGLPTRLTETLREARIRVGETPVGQAAAGRAPVQVRDLGALADDTAVARALGEAGFRSLLAVPLLREQAIVGALVVRRKAAGEFPPSTVDLLLTFAAQSALAIQNARLFQELAVKSQQLEEASRHKSEFLANMSHELRTPLNAIIGFTEVLLERYFGEVNEKQEEYLTDVLSSGQHLLALINDILDLSKVEAGRMELELGTFDLGHALEAGLVMVRERASKKGLELHLDLAEDVGRVEADERKVKQVLFNLLTNAVKFTPGGGRVTVSARRADGLVEVAVIDTGVGIAAEDLGKVFAEFGQAKNQHGQTEGTGLGLALVKRFVELHGGAVFAESEVGKGSTFACTFPVVQSARQSESLRRR